MELRTAWVLDHDDLDHFTEALATAPVITFDLETTGLDPHAVTGGKSNNGVAARVVLASFTVPVEDGGEPINWVLPLSHPDSPFTGRWRSVLTRVCQTMINAPGGLVGHHVKFDTRWLHAATGVDLAHRIIWDTQVSSHLLDETRSTKLKERAPDTFGVERWDDFDLTYPGAAEDVPLFDLGRYAALDTYWTHRLYDQHRWEMHPAPDEIETPDDMEAARLGRLADFCAMPTVRTLATIEQNGIGLDLVWVQDQLAEHRKLAAELITHLSSLYPLDGEPSFAPTSKWFQQWAALAVDQGDLIIAATTPTGKPQWSKAVLARQARAGSDVAEALLGLRDHVKKAEFLTAWLERVSVHDRIHSTYNIGSVSTGRLSSSSPNLQQVTAALRPAFIPSPGHVIVDLDYSQIELRVAAFIARSVPMIEAFQRGDDLHTLLASKIAGKSPADVTPEERQAGKASNFGILYSQSPAGFREYAETAYGVTLTAEEAEEMHAAFFLTWKGMREWHHAVVARLHRDGQIISPIGRVRRLPGVWDGNDYLVGQAERAAINSPVQGFASDLMQMSAASIAGHLPGHDHVPGARLVATVHDSLVIEAPADGWRAVAEECRNRMEGIGKYVQDHFGIDLDVPLVAEGKAGTRWGMADLGTV